MGQQNLYECTDARNPLLRMFNYLLLVIAVAIVIIPLYIVFNISFKTDVEFLNTGIIKLPESFLNFENYANVIEKGKLFLGFKNTLILILASVTGSILFGMMVSYILGRFDFRFKKVILNAFLLSTIIPSITTQVATFGVIKSLGLYNTIFAGMIIYLAADVIQIYIFLQFVTKIPVELDESAMIDGASYFQIFYKIIIPQMKPAIATTVILKTLTIYNDMFTPYLYMPSSKLRTVTTSIMKFSYDQNSQWNVMAAGIVAAVIPTLLLYLFLQRYILAGVTDGAVKG